MTHKINLNGLKSVILDGVKHEINSVDIHDERGCVGIAVRLQGTIKATTLRITFTNEVQA